MKRLRMAAFAALASLAFVPGCCCFDGQFLNRMGLGSQPNCGCSECGPSCSSTPCGGSGCCGTPCCNGAYSTPFGVSDGPFLGDPPAGFQTQPPGGMYEQGPQPRIAPQAQPMPAPASLIKTKN